MANDKKVLLKIEGFASKATPTRSGSRSSTAWTSRSTAARFSD